MRDSCPMTTRSTPIGLRYYDLIDQLVRTKFRDSTSRDNLFSHIKTDIKANTFNQMRKRGGNPSLATIDLVASDIGLDLNYFTDRNGAGQVDYREYLRHGERPGTVVPAPIAEFLATPMGSGCTEDQRRDLFEYERRFGPMTTALAVQAAHAALVATRSAQTQMTPPGRSRPAAALVLHEQRTRYRKH